MKLALKTVGRIALAVTPWVVIGCILIPPWLAEREPAENWFRVASITISDTKEGEPVIMNVSREIRRPFVGSWVATIRRMDDTGVTVFCNAFGTSSYKPDATLPKPLTLDWWTHPMKCAIPKGKYKLGTVWTFDVANNVTKVVTADSNIFEVY